MDGKQLYGFLAELLPATLAHEHTHTHAENCRLRDSIQAAISLAIAHPNRKQSERELRERCSRAEEFNAHTGRRRRKPKPKSGLKPAPRPASRDGDEEEEDGP